MIRMPIFTGKRDDPFLHETSCRASLYQRISHRVPREFWVIGKLQNEQGVIHVMAEEIIGLPALGLPEQASHNYH